MTQKPEEESTWEPAPIEKAAQEGRIGQDDPAHLPAYKPKSEPAGPTTSAAVEMREFIVISSPEPTPPQKIKGPEAKSSVHPSRPSKRKAVVLDSSEEESVTANSLAIPFKLHTKKSTTPGSQVDKTIQSPKVSRKKSRPSLTSRAQIPSNSATPHLSRHDKHEMIVQSKPVLNPFRSVNDKYSSHALSDKKAKKKSSNSSKKNRRRRQRQKANARAENTQSLKTSTVKKRAGKTVLGDEDSGIPLKDRRMEQNSIPIVINGETFLPPRMGEGSARRPTKEELRKEALDKFGTRLNLAKSDFLALCRSRGEYPTRKELDLRAFPKDFQFEPSNETPPIPSSPEEDKNVMIRALEEDRSLGENRVPGPADIENVRRRHSRRKKFEKGCLAILKEEPNIVKGENH
ncbi:unnamed protein product [Tuber aestivum]|uniref:Uncharacterized protein n=1 Tax=Tuber aestivum TaxID=59557 RepID=A0A292PXS5_9PEZI|nr:unnamed protein product [Tuber aestivum]